MRLMVVFVLLLSVAGCASTQYSAMYSELDVMKSEVAAGRMTDLEYAKKAVGIVDKNFPTEFHLQALARYRVLLATQFEKKEITAEEYAYRWSAAQAEFTEKNNEKMAQAARQQGPGITAADLIMLQMINRPFNQYRQGGNCTTDYLGVTHCY